MICCFLTCSWLICKIKASIPQQEWYTQNDYYNMYICENKFKNIIIQCTLYFMLVNSKVKKKHIMRNFTKCFTFYGFSFSTHINEISWQTNKETILNALMPGHVFWIKYSIFSENRARQFNWIMFYEKSPMNCQALFSGKYQKCYWVFIC